MAVLNVLECSVHLLLTLEWLQDVHVHVPPDCLQSIPEHLLVKTVPGNTPQEPPPPSVGVPRSTSMQNFRVHPQALNPV